MKLAEKWITTWACAHRATTFTRWNQKSFEYVIDNNLFGDSIRCGFCNLYGTHDYEIQRAWVEIQGERKKLISEGEENFIVKAGEYRCYSDECKASVVPGKIVVHIDFYRTDRPESGQTFKYNSGGIAMLLQSVEIKTTHESRVMAVFGDSIAHWGFWFEPYKRALHERMYGNLALFEMGIDGNRLLNDSPTHAKKTWGYSGEKRFKHDILDINGLTDCIFCLGRNDLALPLEAQDNVLSYERFTSAIDYMISELHRKNVYVTGLTMLPIRRSSVFGDDRCQLRKELNEWILHSAPFDNVIDVNQEMAMTNDEEIRPEYVWSDDFHINLLGGEKMKEVIDARYIYSC